MTVYVIAQLTFINRSAYNRYQGRFMDVLQNSTGRLLAADEHPQVLEGEWQREKVVLLAFPDEANFRAWSNSREYQEILKDRKAGADAVVLLVRGLS
jgi:uncharacterized protein (DUF1330 family)